MQRALLALLSLLAVAAFAQDRLPHMPRYGRYEKLRRDISGSITRGDITVRWAADSKSFSYLKAGKRMRFDLKTGKEAEDTGGTTDATPTPPGGRGQRRNPDRGRQFDSTTSADGKLKAVCRNRNVVIS